MKVHDLFQVGVIFQANKPIRIFGTGGGMLTIQFCGYKIETEMASLKYIILMTSVCDDFSHYDRLYEALAETDRNLGNVSKDRKDVITIPQIEVKNQKAVYSIYKALNMDGEDVDHHHAAGIDTDLCCAKIGIVKQEIESCHSKEDKEQIGHCPHDSARCHTHHG